jgi:hypothetical protein
MPGDANGDGQVDVSDLGILAANYGRSNSTWAQGDFNGDELVDVGDLGILAAHYSEGIYGSLNFNADDAGALGITVADDITSEELTGSTICGAPGLPLVVGLILAAMALMEKLEE